MARGRTRAVSTGLRRDLNSSRHANKFQKREQGEKTRIDCIYCVAIQSLNLLEGAGYCQCSSRRLRQGKYLLPLRGLTDSDWLQPQVSEMTDKGGLFSSFSSSHVYGVGNTESGLDGVDN